MYMKIRLGRFFAAALAVAVSSSVWAQTPAVPEPGLVIYGPVVNITNHVSVQPTNIQWQVAGGGDGITVNSTIVVVNGAVYQVTRIPFETRSVGSANFTRTPGTIGLSATPTTYQRAVTANGLPATILDSTRNTLGSFAFGLADRGVVERVTLGVTVPSSGGGNTNAPPEIDANLQINAQGGLSFQWSSVAGTHYTVYRTTDLSKPFVAIAVNLPATPPKNFYSDPSPPVGATNLFYRIQFSQ